MSVSDLSEIELYRDPDSGRLVAVDPATGDRYPVPFEELDSKSANIEEAEINKDGSATTAYIDAGEL